MRAAHFPGMVTPMFSLKDYLRQRAALIDKALDKRLPKATTRPRVLHEAMRYSVFSGGKRVRPILCLAAAEAVGGKAKDLPAGRQVLTAACAIELLHTYTLIHDDLPAMDDDDLRRGKPTSHKKFGEANAILAGDALLTLTFEWLADYPALAKELAQATGSQGTVGGQVEDLAPQQTRSKRQRERQLLYIHLNKTAKLIQAAVRIGAMTVTTNRKMLTAIGDYGENLGLAFQLVDDVLDEKDAEPVTAIKVYGRGRTLEKARRLVTRAKRSLEKLTGDSTTLSAIADFVIERTY